MKKKHHYLLIAGGVVAAYVAYQIYRAISAGITDIKGVFNFITGSVGSAAGAVADNAKAAASIPSLTATSQNLDTQITNANNTDYAPGGRIYNNILATQGQAAADAAWAKVQSDDASMSAQTGSAWGNLLSGLFGG